MSWEQNQFDEAIERVKKRIGALAWGVLGPESKVALVHSEVLSVLAVAPSIENSPHGRLASLTMKYSSED